MFDDDNLRNCFVISACMHVAVALVFIFGLPSIFKPLPPPPMRSIPFDIVDIGELTNTRLPNSVEGDIKPGAQMATAKEAAPTPDEKPAAPKPAPAPEPKPPEPAPKPETKPEPPQKEAKQEEIDDAALPKPQSKPTPPPQAKPQPPQPRKDQLASILKNLTQNKNLTSQNNDTKANDAKPAHESGARNDGGKSNGVSQSNGTSGGGYGTSLSDRLTISQEDALRRQIAQCWNIPSGARNAEDLVVEVLIEVNPDRTVKEAQVVDQMRLSTDSFFRAAAESAMRALRNPKCSPLELPPDQYEQWKTIRFTFDPRDVL